MSWTSAFQFFFHVGAPKTIYHIPMRINTHEKETKKKTVGSKQILLQHCQLLDKKIPAIFRGSSGIFYSMSEFIYSTISRERPNDVLRNARGPGNPARERLFCKTARSLH